MSTTLYDYCIADMKKEAAEYTLPSKGVYKSEKRASSKIEKVSQDKRMMLLTSLRDCSEKTASRRKMVSDITSSFIPTLVLSWNPNNQASQLFIKKLDKALQQITGLDRMKVVALDTLMDKQTASKLDVPENGAIVYRGEKKLLTIPPGSSSMDMAKTLSENRSLLS